MLPTADADSPTLSTTDPTRWAFAGRDRTAFMEVGIVAQQDNDRAMQLAEAIADQLSTPVRLDESTAGALRRDGSPVDTFDECDLIVSIGGDGTFLFAARGAGGTPILGVNLGEVGFLNAVDPDGAIDAVEAELTKLQEGTATIRESPRLAAYTNGWRSHPATNEIVVQGDRRGPGGGIGFETRIDGALYSSGSADGVLVATPTGSTAYNMSERGPLVHPGVDGMVLTEMCSTGGMPSLVVDDASTIHITVTDTERAIVVSDGRITESLDAPVDVRIERTDPPLRIAGPPTDFFEALGKLE